METPHNASDQDSSYPDAIKKTRISLATFRGLSRGQLLYIPRLLSRRERIQFVLLATLASAALLTLSVRLLLRFTEVVPAVGGVIREGMVIQPRFFNPLYASNDTDRDITNIVFSRLITHQDGRVVMDLAREVRISEDGKTYTVRLREDVRWHDGQAFGADDVLFTIKTIQDPEYLSPSRQNWQGVTATKIDDYTVEFSLRQPYAPFMQNLSVGIIPEHLWRRVPRDAAILSDLNLKPVGTGPYKFAKFSRTEDGTITAVVLERNKTYHRAGPYLQEVRFVFYESEDQVLAAYRRNEIDSFFSPLRTRVNDLHALDVQLHTIKLPKVFAVFFNQANQQAFSRKPVREALAQAINRDRLISLLASGGSPTSSALPAGTFGANPPNNPISYDPELARAALEKDGWRDGDGDGVLERTERSGSKRSTQKLVITLATSDSEELQAVANAIGGMWEAIGVKTEVQAYNINDLEYRVIRPRAYQALLFGEVFGYDPDPFAFWHTSQIKDPGLNIALYSNRTVDELLELARRTHEETIREEKYRAFQKILNDEIAAIFLYTPEHYYATRKNIAGIRVGQVALPEERFNGIHSWFEETKRSFSAKDGRRHAGTAKGSPSADKTGTTSGGRY